MKMDKNTIVGLLLIGAILLTFSIFNQPEEMPEGSNSEEVVNQIDSLKNETEEIAEPEVAVIDLSKDSLFMDSIADDIKGDEVALKSYVDSVQIAMQSEEEKNLKAARELIESEKYGVFAHAKDGENQYYTIENNKIIVRLSNKGGRIVDVKLKEYQTWQNYHDSPDSIQPMQLFEEETSSQSLRLIHNENPINTGDVFFNTKSPSEVVVENEAKDIVFKLETKTPGKYLEFRYSLAPDKYDIDYTVSFVNLDDVIRKGDVDLNWAYQGLSTEKLASDERMTSTVMYRYFNEKRDYLSETSDDELELEGHTNWVAFKHKFFSSVLISEDGFKKGKVTKKMTEDDRYNVFYSTDLSMPALDEVKFKFFFGPNEQDALGAFDNGMDGIINLGWGIFRWVNKIMIQPVFNWLRGTGIGLGIVILLVTLFVKIVITPLTYKNYLSSAKMRVLKPEVDKINEKYKDKPDPVKKQQETMALYRATGVNPMAGCIPMLVQMPILLAVFRFFPSSIHLRHANFLWADDLSSFDSVWDFGFDIPIYGDHMSLFALLMAGSTLIYTLMNSNQMTASSQPGMPNMKIIMYFFPVMMLFFFNKYSAGLSYYYLCGNLMNIGIMWAIKKYMIDEDKIRLQLANNKKKPRKQSAFQKRMEEMSKKQKALKNKK